MKRRYYKECRKVVITYSGEESKAVLRSKIIKLLMEDIERGSWSYDGDREEQNRDICKREQG